MNINQVKKTLRINFSLTNRAALERASEYAKKRIITARRENDDAEAARCSEARQFLKNRLKGNACLVCGAPISDGAAKCRLHMRKLALAGPERIASPKRPRGQARDGSNPAGGMLARLGYYTPQVQKVVTRWRAIIAHNDLLEDYFRAVARPLICRESTLGRLPPVVPVRHWQAIFELGVAIASVFNDESDPAPWLLRFPDAMTNGRYYSFAQIRDWAGRQSPQAREPSVAAYKAKAARMLLLSPGNRVKKTA